MRFEFQTSNQEDDRGWLALFRLNTAMAWLQATPPTKLVNTSINRETCMDGTALRGGCETKLPHQSKVSPGFRACCCAGCYRDRRRPQSPQAAEPVLTWVESTRWDHTYRPIECVTTQYKIKFPSIDDGDTTRSYVIGHSRPGSSQRVEVCTSGSNGPGAHWRCPHT